jgi:hypothetical protein
MAVKIVVVKIVVDVFNWSSRFLSIIVYFSTIIIIIIIIMEYGFIYRAEEGMHKKSFTIRKKTDYMQIPK